MINYTGRPAEPAPAGAGGASGAEENFAREGKRKSGAGPDAVLAYRCASGEDAQEAEAREYGQAGPGEAREEVNQEASCERKEKIAKQKRRLPTKGFFLSVQIFFFQFGRIFPREDLPKIVYEFVIFLPVLPRTIRDSLDGFLTFRPAITSAALIAHVLE